MTLDPIANVIGRLTALGLEPRKASEGYSCSCPAHKDRSPSLSIGIGSNGQALIKCHKGCSLDSILSSLHLKTSDLFSEDGATKPRHSPSVKKRTFVTSEEALAAYGLGKPSAEWHYHAAEGELVGVVARWDALDGKKIRPASLSGGTWVLSAMPAPRPLYRLPELLSGVGTIYVAEGEKAAEALLSIGLTATTSASGAKAAAITDWSHVEGHEVVVLPDNDAPGEAYATDVARLCHAAGAASVVIVRLREDWPAMPDGGDAHDWLEHNDAQDADDLRHRLEKLVEQSPQMPAAAGPAAELIDWQPFPVEHLPEPLRSFTVEAAAAIGCDCSMIALPLLTAVGAAIGNDVRMQVRPEWQETAILWTAVVADSGSSKTPAFRKALQFSDDAQEEAFTAHGILMAEHEAEVQSFDLALSLWKKKGGGGPAPAQPKLPKATRYVLNDTTVEALIAILTGNPRGVLVAVDELAGWIASFDQYKNGRGGADCSKWLSMHTAGSVTSDRKGSGTLNVPKAFVCVTGGIQPGPLSRAMKTNTDTGFLARLLLAQPPRTPKVWTTAAVGFATMAAMRGTFKALLADGDGKPIVIGKTPAAEDAFAKFYVAHAQEQMAASGAMAAMLAKIEAYAARLTLIHHVVSVGTGSRIEPASVEAGVALARWFAREARRIYGSTLTGPTANPADDDADAAAHWLAGQPEGFSTIRDLAHGPRRFRNSLTAAEAAAARLVRVGRAVRHVQPSGAAGGRPTDGIRLVVAP